MIGKYEPWVIGVEHTPAFAKRTIAQVLSLTPKIVGIEFLDQGFTENQTFIHPSAFLFFRKIRKTLEKRGIIVVALLPGTLPQRVGRLKKVYRPEEFQGDIEIVQLHIDTNAMERRMRRFKPDVVIVGAFHAALIRKDLGIPKAKCIMILQPYRSRMASFLLHGSTAKISMEIIKRRLRRLREFQHQRRKTKLARRK